MPENHTISGTKVYGTINLGGGRREAISPASGQQSNGQQDNSKLQHSNHNVKPLLPQIASEKPSEIE
jgi:hypothetical protein